MTLRFHNSLTRRLEPFEPIEPGRVRMYTCGPTVYDRAHVGNFRAFLWEDLLRRYLKWKGFEVDQVMNLTDVDDRTIAAARERGMTLAEVTEPVIGMFVEDWDTLGLEAVEHSPRATEHVGGMIALIQKLLDRGLAYEADGSIYFAIGKFPGYGRLANLDPAELVSAQRAAGDEEYDKDDARDFVLWKGGEREEGDVAVWDSPWGQGRPGWHLECSAMAMEYLGDTLDIHTGGVDNLFPHHTNEIAQSEGATGQTFSNNWLHAAHLLVEGQKMSKSLGNCYTIPELVEKGHQPSSIRYLLLSGHYRSQLNFKFDGLVNAAHAVGRIHEFRRRVQAVEESSTWSEGPLAALAKEARVRFEEAMDNDLNVSDALAAVFNLVREGNHQLDRVPLDAGGVDNVLAFLADFEAVFGVLSLRDREGAGPDEGLVAWAIERLAARDLARANRDFGQADAIRDEMAAKDVVVEDLADVTRLRLGAQTVVVPKPAK